MPTATKFEAEGVDNGFPFCCPKINVNDMWADGSGTAATFWITLGGNKKGDPVDPDKYGLAEAMKFYWNFYAAWGTADHTMTWVTPPSGEASGSTSLHSANVDNDTIESNPRPEPKDRTCLTELRFRKTDSDGSAFSLIQRDPVTTDPVGDGEPIVRMYDGDISDEANFVGYGFYTLPDLAIEALGDGAAINFTTGRPFNSNPFREGYSIVMALQSYTDFTTGSDTDIAYTLLDGINFTCIAATPGFFSATLDAANRTASLSTTISTGPYARTETHTNTISSLDFYTYPA